MAARASGEAARAVVRERARPRPVRGAGAALSLAGTRGATRRMERAACPWRALAPKRGVSCSGGAEGAGGLRRRRRGAPVLPRCWRRA